MKHPITRFYAYVLLQSIRTSSGTLEGLGQVSRDATFCRICGTSQHGSPDRTMAVKVDDLFGHLRRLRRLHAIGYTAPMFQTNNLGHLLGRTFEPSPHHVPWLNQSLLTLHFHIWNSPTAAF